MNTLAIPTAVTSREISLLRGFAEGGSVLELGSLLGYSTVNLARVAHHVVSVDPHEGYPVDNPRPTLARFLETLDKYQVRDKVRVCVGTDGEILPLLQRRQFNLVFIDMTGEYADTLRAIRLAVPLLKDGGRLAVHDCGHPDWPGALDAVREWAHYACVSYQIVDRLAIFEPQRW